ncbi:acyltransferase family protein [Levilactobacillus acidifarinae]|uniref:Cps1E protein n=1 Tax=Levilactobacillus acidifarinae DSM 19394 = JCM 15949 TaxID=1423715 RepID=A0A0R1LNG4_9LACO|nr:acyltransferase [Levilactobacillus acidifarinae]KRK95123.1 cps1E protein [Levilactobacillus acidifarinae DSM 19394]GEO70622.1 acyltransferase/acetyltransferase [Levilactobacillus acidifarinae]
MNQIQVNKGRIKWVDAAKGMAILLVVYGHALEGTHANIQFNNLAYEYQHGLIYSFHMPLFFLLSGYFINSWLHRPAGVAIKQKVVSLLVPYVVWSILQGALMVVMHSKSTVNHGWKTLLLIPIEPLDQFWFIYAMFFGLMIIYFLWRWTHRVIPAILISLIVILLTSNNQVWQFQNIAIATFYLGAGYYFKNNIGQMFLTNRWWFRGALILFIMFFSIAFFYMSELLVNPLFKIVLAFLGSYVIMEMAQVIQPYWLVFLGRNSLEIYVSHWIFLAGSRTILIHFGILNAGVLVGVTTVIGVLLPIVLYEVLKKLTLSRLFFGR